MANQSTQDPQSTYPLPEGYRVTRLQEMSQEDQHKYMGQVFNLLEENYPGFAKSESQDVWESRLYKAEKEGTTLMVSAVIDPKGNVAGASALERYDESVGQGAALITYSLGHKKDENYADVLHASKKDILESVEALQQSGVKVSAVFQEHIIGKESHAPKINAGYDLGQVPLSSPTSAVPFSDYTIPIFTADAPPNATQEQIQKAKSEATKADLFMADIKPSDPDKPLAETVRAFALAYTQNNSYFKDHPEQDPGYQSMMKYADSLPNTLTYQQAYEASAVGAAQQLKLDSMVRPLTEVERERGIEAFSHKSERDQSQILQAVSKDSDMAKAYADAGPDHDKKLKVLETYPELDAAYKAERLYESKIEALNGKPEMVEGRMNQFRQLMENNIREGNLSNIKSSLEHAHALPERDDLRHQAELAM